jgi:hypothetical protein
MWPKRLEERRLEMSVARARDLLQRLVSDSNLANKVDGAKSRQDLRDIVNQAGYGDVSGEDILQAIGGELVLKITKGQWLIGAGMPDAVRERAYVLATKAGDGCQPSPA